MDTLEMGLTNRQINLIAFEANNITGFESNLDEDFSNRVWNIVNKATLTTGLSMSYIVRRCKYINAKEYIKIDEKMVNFDIEKEMFLKSPLLIHDSLIILS